MAIRKLEKPNEGVKCIVNTCEYYMNGDHCAAEQIKVEPRNAKNSGETDCSTFSQKNQTF